jgi:hypothetical protein
MRLTDYQLSCGSVQFQDVGADHVELYKEHNVYHVRRFSRFVDGLRRVQECWLTLTTLTDARRAFKRQCDIAKAVNK